MSSDITVRDLAQAMIEDETPKAVGWYFMDPDGKGYQSPPDGLYRNYTIGSTCAFGGAALKLGVDPDWLADVASTILKDGIPSANEDDYQYNNVRDVVFEWNDGTDKSKADIGRLILDNADEATLSAVLIRAEDREIDDDDY